MSSKPVYIGFQGLYPQQRKSYIGFEGFEKEYDDDIPRNYPSGNPNSNSSLPVQTNQSSSSDYSSTIAKTRSSSFSNETSHLPIQRLSIPFISTIYTEFITIWFKTKWLRFTDNHQETFLILNPDITGYLTVQMAINQNCFVNTKYPLISSPECLLIRTEINNKSLLLPNSMISFEHLLARKNESSQGKLIAIICNEKNSKIMFYKASSHNHWSIFDNNQIKSSRSYSYLLSDEQQLQLQSILEQKKFIHPSQLSFPLSALCNHPIIFIYIIIKFVIINRWRFIWGNNDNEDLFKYLGNETRIGYIQSRCEEYLDMKTFRHKICFDSGEYVDELEFYAPVGSSTIQKIINDRQDLDPIQLRRPAPDILPIIISKIANDMNSFIIPSEILNINSMLPRSPKYQLEAIICEINERPVIFIKHLSTNEWYYYQKNYTCEQFSSNLSENLNEILQSKSIDKQTRLIQSAHFLVSMIFYNPIKYIYKQDT